jgi:hypothetical protein
MRLWKNLRKLKPNEVHVALKVFRHTVPYNDILISDGYGVGDRPFTVPISLPVPLLRLPPFYRERYVIHAGDYYKGMGLNGTQDARETLIHELTHVWQGEHATSAYWLFCLAAQELTDAPYVYDKDFYQSDWEFYDMEQQAQIVEDWFHDGMKSYDPDTETGDKRFYFIKAIIQGESTGYNWLTPVVKPLPHATLRLPPLK